MTQKTFTMVLAIMIEMLGDNWWELCTLGSI